MVGVEFDVRVGFGPILRTDFRDAAPLVVYIIIWISTNYKITGSPEEFSSIFVIRFSMHQYTALRITVCSVYFSWQYMID